MNSVDWESKFNAIVRDTVHNLDRVNVCVFIKKFIIYKNRRIRNDNYSEEFSMTDAMALYKYVYVLRHLTP